MRERLSQTTRNMLLSFGAVFALLAVFYLLQYRPAPDDPVKVIDYAPTLVAVRTTGAFAAAAPVGLGPDWRATSVRYVPSDADFKIATWHLGFMTPAERYVGLEQTNGTDDDFVKESTTKGRPDGTQVVGGQTWKRYHSDSTGYNSLMLKDNGITTVVAGSVSYDELGAFIGTLRTS